jgi:hypothetical protein
MPVLGLRRTQWDRVTTDVSRFAISDSALTAVNGLQVLRRLDGSHESRPVRESSNRGHIPLQ